MGRPRCSEPNVGLGAGAHTPASEKAAVSAVVLALLLLYSWVSLCDPCKLTLRKTSHLCLVPRPIKSVSQTLFAGIACRRAVPSLLPASPGRSSPAGTRGDTGERGGRTRVCVFCHQPWCKPHHPFPPSPPRALPAELLGLISSTAPF